VTKKLLKVEEFAELAEVSRQRAYEILRSNPELVVNLGERQIRVDSEKLKVWIDRGGVESRKSVACDAR